MSTAETAGTAPWSTARGKDLREDVKLQAQSQAKSTPTARGRQGPNANSSLPVSSGFLSLQLSPPRIRKGCNGNNHAANVSNNLKVENGATKHRNEAANGAGKRSTEGRTVPFTSRQYYAVDTEMVTVSGPGEAPERRVMVSIGIVNQKLETVLYARVRVPQGSHVTNGAFARVEGGLWASWDEGLPASCVSDFLAQHVSAGGVIIGWELHGDLEVIGFEKAAALVKNGYRESLPLDVGAASSASNPCGENAGDAQLEPNQGDENGNDHGPNKAHDNGVNIHAEDSSGDSLREASTLAKEASGMRVVEVTDYFRTAKGGLKCMLSEAYGGCFDKRQEGYHNAATDARMTMELYNLWRRVGEPKIAMGIPLSLYTVNFHSFKSADVRKRMLWEVLRPERAGRQVLLEKDSGMNTYKLCFRNERERDAYMNLLEVRMTTAGLEWGPEREEVPGRNGSWGGYQLSCKVFKMHVLENER